MKQSQSAFTELINDFRKYGQIYGLNKVFTTYLELFALSLSMTLDPFNHEISRDRFREKTSSRSQEEEAVYARMFALTCIEVLESRDNPYDILGNIFHKLNLNNQWNGQYFTPDYISRLVAGLVNADIYNNSDQLIRINEPACGSGSMIIGTAWAMKRKKIDYNQRCLFIAQDIDIRCVWMTYIQSCLYRIPAVVIHGDTLAQTENSIWYTPNAAYILAKKEEDSDKNEKKS